MRPMPEAVAKIFALKGRPADHPLIVHLASDPRPRRLGGRRSRWRARARGGVLARPADADPAQGAAGPADRHRRAGERRPALSLAPGGAVAPARLRAQRQRRSCGAVGQPLRPCEPDDRAARARRVRRRSSWSSTAAPARSGWNRPSSTCRAARRSCCDPARSRANRSRPSSAQRHATAMRTRRAHRARWRRTTLRARRCASSPRPRSTARLPGRAAAPCSPSGRPFPRQPRSSRPPRTRRATRTTSTPTCAPSMPRVRRRSWSKSPPDTPSWEAVNDRLARAAAGAQAIDDEP